MVEQIIQNSGEKSPGKHMIEMNNIKHEKSNLQEKKQCGGGFAFAEDEQRSAIINV